jgi:hypothetical protein
MHKPHPSDTTFAKKSQYPLSSLFSPEAYFNGGGIHFCHPFPIEPAAAGDIFFRLLSKNSAKRVCDSLRIPLHPYLLFVFPHRRPMIFLSGIQAG